MALSLHRGAFLRCLLVFVCISFVNAHCELNTNHGFQKPKPITLSSGIDNWKALLIILAFGIISIVINIVYRVVRNSVFHDGNLTDTFFDAGGNMPAILVAVYIVAISTWGRTFSSSTNMMWRYGIAGQFWYAAGLTVHLFLFSIVAAAIRIKSPGAKTFLQVIRARFGLGAHVVLIVFSLCVNLTLASVILAEGSRLLTNLTSGLGIHSAAILSCLLAVIIGIKTAIGGLGGSIYLGFFSVATYLVMIMVLYVNVFSSAFSLSSDKGYEKMYQGMSCGIVAGDHQSDKYLGTNVTTYSTMTFISYSAVLDGITLAISGFAWVFIDQTYWGIAISANPTNSVVGILFGAFSWFTVPFSFAFTVGVAYYLKMYEGGQGMHLATETDARQGLITSWVIQEYFGETGSYLVFCMIMIATVVCASSKVLSASSVIVYDIYQTYIGPYRAQISIDSDDEASRRARMESYLAYDKKCGILRVASAIILTVLLVPIAYFFNYITFDLGYVMAIVSITASTTVFPIILSVTWHRITATGMLSGLISGLIVGIIIWLSVTSTEKYGLTHFAENSYRDIPQLSSIVCSMFISLIVTIVVSLFTGGCSKELKDHQVWAKCQQIDSPIAPWVTRYADCLKRKDGQMSASRPHFYEMRSKFKCTEIAAYVFGVLFTIVFIFVWPWGMFLIGDEFQFYAFKAWVGLVLALMVINMIMLLLLPLAWEIFRAVRYQMGIQKWEEEREPVKKPVDQHPRRSILKKRPQSVVRSNIYTHPPKATIAFGPPIPSPNTPSSPSGPHPGVSISRLAVVPDTNGIITSHSESTYRGGGTVHGPVNVNVSNGIITGQTETVYQMPGTYPAGLSGSSYHTGVGAQSGLSYHSSTLHSAAGTSTGPSSSLNGSSVYGDTVGNSNQKWRAFIALD